MKKYFFFNPRSINQRLMVLYGITIVLILALVATYTMQVVSLEKKLETMEQIEDIFNSILGLRRYEKNIMLRLGEKNVTNADQSLNKIEIYLQKLAPKIKTAEEKELFKCLKVDFVDYQTIFNTWCTTDDCITHTAEQEDSHVVRQQGQKLMESAAELAKFNRKNISHGFKIILFWLTFMPAAVLLCGVLLFFSQMQSILNRLASLKQATKSLAAGEFKQLPMLNPPDEITQLVKNFNEMVVALEQKQEELIQSKKMASIGTFSSGIAHEINNPLNNISLSTDTLLEEFDSMDEEETREILDDIMAQTERASKIVRNLLDFSRAQSSETQALYIDFVLHKTTNLIANELRIHKVALKKDIADMLPQVNGDLHKLQQVFLNLIINAEQAIGDYGSIVVKVRATDNGFIRTDIIDNGPGIAQENLEQIFDPFFTTKEAGKGTGLGLSIVYGIVKKHNGYIEVTSELGKGTTFSVYLPVFEVQEQDIDQQDDG
jgi:signal transduction histidine kinase